MDREDPLFEVNGQIVRPNTRQISRHDERTLGFMDIHPRAEDEPLACALALLLFRRQLAFVLIGGRRVAGIRVCAPGFVDHFFALLPDFLDAAADFLGAATLFRPCSS
jgi:hypothetical protein